MNDPRRFLRQLFDVAAAAASDLSGFASGLPAVSGRVFEAPGDAIITGATGTNVNDLRAVLILPEGRRA